MDDANRDTIRTTVQDHYGRVARGEDAGGGGSGCDTSAAPGHERTPPESGPRWKRS